MTLPRDKISPAARAKMENFHASVIEEVKRAISEHRVVVLGMAWNSHCTKACKALDAAGIEHHYIEYGSYISMWRQRLAIKLWSGWPTFPQVFVDGVLIGGEDLTKAAIADGTLTAKPTKLVEARA
jgi:glutaredoxin-related protein